MGLPTRRTLNYAAKTKGRYNGGPNIDPEARAIPVEPGARLVPLFLWFDSTHIARVAQYRDLVFGPGGVQRGHFIEDTLGTAQQEEIKALGWPAFARYGTYLWEEAAWAGKRPVGHLNGRRFEGLSGRTTYL